MVLPNTNATKSYWIEAAESPLRDYRSSDQLPAETDVVIIGSGMAGASTAYWIHKVRRARVTNCTTGTAVARVDHVASIPKTLPRNLT